MKNFIPLEDGYTETGYIAERKGVYESCRFKYRRMLHSERARITATNGNTNDFVKAMYRGLESHVKEWDVMKWSADDADGSNAETLPIKAANIARLSPTFIEIMFNIVAGYAPSDDDPNAVPQTVPDELDAVINGDGNGSTRDNIHDRAAEADSKN